MTEKHQRQQVSRVRHPLPNPTILQQNRHAAQTRQGPSLHTRHTPALLSRNPQTSEAVQKRLCVFWSHPGLPCHPLQGPTHTCGRSHSQKTPETGPMFCWRRQPWTRLAPICTCERAPGSVLVGVDGGIGSARDGKRACGTDSTAEHNTARRNWRQPQPSESGRPASRPAREPSCRRLLRCVVPALACAAHEPLEGVSALPGVHAHMPGLPHTCLSSP
jgi:hypothetical protein